MKAIYNKGNYISYIQVDPNNPYRIWITQNNYDKGNKVLEYDGNEWKNITGNLPNVPVNCITYQENSPDRLYIGTDIGVFYSENNSAYWELFGKGLPNVVVSELEIQYDSQMLIASTYGRGIWQTKISDCDMQPPVVNVKGSTEICKGDSVVLEAEAGHQSYKWSTGDTTRSITVKDKGTYSVSVSGDNGCVARSEAIFVDVLTFPELKVKISGPNPICVGETGEISASFGYPDDNYKWSNGATGRKIEASEPGIYYVEAENSNGCIAYSDTVELLVSQPPDKPTITRNGNELVASKAQLYQWYLNDIPIEGANDKSIEIKQNGSYTVEVTVGSSCKAISDPYDVTTGVAEFENGEFIKIQPNPVHRAFAIDMNLIYNGPLEISIKTLNGVEVYKNSQMYDGRQSSKEINMEGLAAGTYYITVKYGEKVFAGKIIKL